MPFNQRGFKKFIIYLAALLLLAGFLIALLHHHEDGYHFHDCSVCRFVGGLQALTLFLIVFAFLTGRAKFFSLPSNSRALFFFFSRLKNRAPPVLS